MWSCTDGECTWPLAPLPWVLERLLGPYMALLSLPSWTLQSSDEKIGREQITAVDRPGTVPLYVKRPKQADD